MWRFTFFFWLHFHSQDLPEPYTSIRPKRTPEHITPEWMRYKRGKPCGVLTFFVNWFPQPECSRTHTSMKPNWKKTWKACGVFSSFAFISTARTFQKPTAAWEAKNKPTAKSFQKPTPEWDTKKRWKPCDVLTFFCELTFTARTFQNPTPQWDRKTQENHVAF